MQRLPALRAFDSAKLTLILRVIGRHPRMLEFLDAFLRGGQGRLPHVTRKLTDLLERSGLDLRPEFEQLEDGFHATVMIGTRDVLLEELLGLARDEHLDEVLLQAAVSNLPVKPDGLARMLAGDSADVENIKHKLARLADLSLVHCFPDGSAWVHRWTAEGLALLDDKVRHRARCNRAGRYRWWRVAHESHNIEDATEAVRNYLAGQDFDAAAQCAHACFNALRRFQQSIAIAALAAEVLETLPEDHPRFAGVADEEAQAHLALGFTDRALKRHQQVLGRRERLAESEPDRADYQRDLVVSLVRVGTGDEANVGDCLRRALAIMLGLKQSGRLDPVDEPLIEAVEELMRDHGLSPEA